MSTLELSEEHVDGAITAILSSILFVRYQNKVISERKRLNGWVSHMQHSGKQRYRK